MLAGIEVGCVVQVTVFAYMTTLARVLLSFPTPVYLSIYLFAQEGRLKSSERHHTVQSPRRQIEDLREAKQEKRNNSRKKQNNMNLRTVSGVSDEVRVTTVSEFNCVSQRCHTYEERTRLFFFYFANFWQI